MEDDGKIGIGDGTAAGKGDRVYYVGKDGVLKDMVVREIREVDAVLEVWVCGTGGIVRDPSSCAATASAALGIAFNRLNGFRRLEDELNKARKIYSIVVDQMVDIEMATPAGVV